ncbi:unnamed protein product, partial [Phaeothamnion confervicola]
AASYVKWVKIAGARIALVPYDATTGGDDALLAQLNGLLPDGGAEPFTGAVHAIKRVLEVLEVSRQGDRVPLSGTCLGFEWVVQASFLFLGSCGRRQCLNLPTLLRLSVNLAAAPSPSRLFARVPPPEMTAIQSGPLLFDNHSKGISPAAFPADQSLTNLLNVLATRADRVAMPPLRRGRFVVVRRAVAFRNVRV